MSRKKQNRQRILISIYGTMKHFVVSFMGLKVSSPADAVTLVNEELVVSTRIHWNIHKVPNRKINLGKSLGEGKV